MPAPSTVRNEDWPPDYVNVLAWRQSQVMKIRESAEMYVGAVEFYRTRPVEFVNHWCVTFDPRNAGADIPTKMPFQLFRRQAELIEFVMACLRAEEGGLVEKCRDMGATWVLCALSVWLWLFWDGASIGWGSRKEMLVDKLGDPDSIFEKLRVLILALPRDFWPREFRPAEHMAYMKIVNPENGATITGEAGDNIGRGGRKLIYFKDESAHYERPEKIEASLGDNTRVQIDISSVNGLGNVFHRRREAGVEWKPGQPAVAGATNVFVMDWRDHPAKSQAWYEARHKKAVNDGLLHIFAQEVDRNYAAAVDNVIIPFEWVRAAIDAHLVLGFDDSGMWGAALDVADGGGDTNALAKRKGVILKSIEEWGERDTGVTARRAVDGCRNIGPVELQYDCIGVGSGIKAETNRLIDEKLMPRNIRLVPWDAGGELIDPDGRVIPGDKDSPVNSDFYGNFKAQAWWQARRRFEKTYRAVRSKAADATVDEKAFTWETGELISLPSTLPLIRKLEKELSQPTFGQGARMKMIINKQPDGTRSPNLADAVVMAYWPVRTAKVFTVTKDMLERSRQLR